MNENSQESHNGVRKGFIEEICFNFEGCVFKGEKHNEEGVLKRRSDMSQCNEFWMLKRCWGKDESTCQHQKFDNGAEANPAGMVVWGQMHSSEQLLNPTQKNLQSDLTSCKIVRESWLHSFILLEMVALGILLNWKKGKRELTGETSSCYHQWFFLRGIISGYAYFHKWTFFSPLLSVRRMFLFYTGATIVIKSPKCFIRGNFNLFFKNISRENPQD